MRLDTDKLDFYRRDRGTRTVAVTP
jgi:hypothetical protein